MDRDALSDGVFVPVVIDAERVVDGEEMVRVTYFAAPPTPRLRCGGRASAVAQLHGIGALGLAGVVYGALREVGGPGNDTVDSTCSRMQATSQPSSPSRMRARH